MECARNNFRAAKDILTLVPEVGTDGHDGVTESAGPRLVIDVAVSGSQETGALVAGELTLSGNHAHTAVHHIRLSTLQGRPGPVFEDVWASVEEVRFAFPGWPQEDLSVGFVERRWLHPVLVRTGGWKSFQPPNARRAPRRRLP